MLRSTRNHNELRCETNSRDQDAVVREEKAAIYKKCIPFYSEKYHSSLGTVPGAGQFTVFSSAEEVVLESL